jgi:hypothetical protein
LEEQRVEAMLALSCFRIGWFAFEDVFSITEFWRIHDTDICGLRKEANGPLTAFAPNA